MAKGALGFEEPPPPRGRVTYDWAEIADQARRMPNNWLTVFEEDRQSLSVAIRQGNIAALHPDKGFEMVTRNNKQATADRPRLCSLHIRYVPEKDKGE